MIVSLLSKRCMGQIYRNIHTFLLMPFVQPNCCEKPANYETQRVSNVTEYCEAS